MKIVGKYAFNGFSEHAEEFCAPGSASDLSYLCHGYGSDCGKIVPFRSNVWRYELADIIRTTFQSSLAEGT